jgi:cell division protein FtsI (penicillin-binding protein 3)
MKPYLVSSIQQYGVTLRSIEPQVLVEKICSNETLLQLQECLSAVIDSVHGTGHKILFDSAYKIAGKTGTAVTALNNKGYNKGNKIYQASFIGYFPANNPKYTMAVVIQNSNQSRLTYGADVSGRVFKEISDRIYGKYLSTQKYKSATLIDTIQYNYYGAAKDVSSIFSVMNIKYNSNQNAAGAIQFVQVKNNNAIINNSTPSLKNTVPNMVGMGLKDALYTLENAGLKTIIAGKGKVASQSLSAGTLFKKGQTITLLLN